VLERLVGYGHEWIVLARPARLDVEMAVLYTRARQEGAN
jgi:hypothetical protein